MHDAIDPIDLELFKNAVASIADEMALTIVRTAYSNVVKDNMDLSTALADGAGRLIAQGLTIPGHLGSVPTALETVIARYGDGIVDGDLFILNDPFAGGMHLPDIFIIKPIFAGAVRIAFAVAICHHTDVGGRVAGSNAADSTEIFQEGLRLPPLRLFAAGRRDETLVQVISANVRMPGMVMGDLRAQLAACHTAERELGRLVARWGAGGVARLMAGTLDHAERLSRAGLRNLPDGIFSFEDWIDDDGVDAGKPIRVFVTFTKSGGKIRADWTGSSPQVRGAINATLSYTKAVTYCAVRSVLPDDIPTNDGMFRAVEVVAPPGTICNVVPPGACAARGLTGFRMLDCAFGALAALAPDRVFAASDGGLTGVAVGGYRADRRPFVYVEFTSSAWGARPSADGVDGIANMLSNVTSPSVEVTEVEQPLQIRALEYLADRGGPGKFRGGTAIRRSYRFTEAAATLQLRSDRRAHLPYGLAGGAPGRPSATWLRQDGHMQAMPSKFTTTLSRGQEFAHETAGGGGWGDPFERDPALVVEDVRRGFVSVEAAAHDYGVVLDKVGRRIDADATRHRRGQPRPGLAAGS